MFALSIHIHLKVLNSAEEILKVLLHLWKIQEQVNSVFKISSTVEWFTGYWERLRGVNMVKCFKDTTFILI